MIQLKAVMSGCLRSILRADCAQVISGSGQKSHFRNGPLMYSVSCGGVSLGGVVVFVFVSLVIDLCGSDI